MAQIYLTTLFESWCDFEDKKLQFQEILKQCLIKLLSRKQIKVVLRCLWHWSLESHIELCQYVSHTFEEKCASTCFKYVLLRSAEDNELKFPNAALTVNIWSLEKRTSVKLGEVPSLFIFYNITIALLIPLDGFRFIYLLLRDSENKWSSTNCPSIL